MNYSTRCFIFGLLLCISATTRGAVEAKVYNGGRLAVSVGGVELLFVKSFEGGELFAQSVNEPAAEGALPKKHAVVVGYAPITLVVSCDLTANLVSWINDLCAGGAAQRSVVVAQLDFNSVPISVTKYAAATLTEVRFPKWEGASKDPAYVTLVIAPGSGAPTTWTPSSKPAASAKVALANNYRLQCGNLPGGKVASIEGLTIKRSLKGSGPEFSNLMLEVGAADEAPWKAWRDSFLGPGQPNDADEKSFTLDQLLPNLAPPAILSFQFSHVGVLRASSNKFEDNGETIRRFSVELYYEGLTLVGATADAVPAGTTSSAAAVSLLPAPLIGVQSAAPKAFGAALPSPDDKGAKDPADFPRPPGVIRKSFSSVQQKALVQENVVYTATGAFDPIEKFYAKSLGQAGWTLITRFEDNNGVGNAHQLGSSWKRELRTAAITLTEVKTGTEITVKLASTLAP